jgi:glycosyltransferase involved in cell wall biosynthesis
MACAVPVVATKIGIGDIRAVSNVEILVGSTPQEMVDHVIHLLREEGLREKLGDAGYRYVLKNHEWDRINEEFVNISGLSCGPNRVAHGMKS